MKAFNHFLITLSSIISEFLVFFVSTVLIVKPEWLTSFESYIPFLVILWVCIQRTFYNNEQKEINESLKKRIEELENKKDDEELTDEDFEKDIQELEKV